MAIRATRGLLKVGFAGNTIRATRGLLKVGLLGTTIRVTRGLLVVGFVPAAGGQAVRFHHLSPGAQP